MHVLQISHPLHFGQYQLGLISRAGVTREMGTDACQLCACTCLYISHLGQVHAHATMVTKGVL